VFLNCCQKPITFCAWARRNTSCVVSLGEGRTSFRAVWHDLFRAKMTPPTLPEISASSDVSFTFAMVFIYILPQKAQKSQDDFDGAAVGTGFFKPFD